MLFYTLEKLRKAGISDITIVVGYKKELVKNAVEELNLKTNIHFAYQSKAKGTGDALKCGLSKINKAGDVIVVNGDDSAFYKPATVKKIICKHQKEDAIVSFVSLIKDNPTGLGRVVRDKKGQVVDIVEEKDASNKQKKIKEVNAGFYVFDFAWVSKKVGDIKVSASGEYYIVDLVKIAKKENKKILAINLDHSKEWYGVNTQEDLKIANKLMRNA
jgi:bifunctional UDP-N-acetylglucosamine pyrophosphorylase/glucosamine-1-phosphate N-acetyltransferase